MKQSRPILSLIVGARNDAYMGDFQWRFRTSLDFLARNLAAIGRSNAVEVVVCDWNSDVPLHEELVLSPEAAALTRFVVVPPEIARPAQRDSPFPIPIVQNTAIRRTRGKFVGQTDSDVLYTASSLRALLDVLEGKIPGLPAQRAYLAAYRRHLPLAQVRRQPTVDELEEYLRRGGVQLCVNLPGAGYGAPTGLVAMHRRLWEECRGYDEQWIYWGWMDVDLALRITQRYPILDLDNFGVNLVHMEHYQRRDYTDRTHQSRRVNLPIDTPAFEANGADWGLAGHSFPEHRVRQIQEPERIQRQCGTIGHWDLPLDQVVAQITSPEIRKAAQRVVEECQVPTDDLPVLEAAIWYGRQRGVGTFVESGMRGGHVATAVALVSGGAEIYGLVHWNHEVRDEGSHAYHASMLLRMKGKHGGYTQFIGGDPTDAVARLRRILEDRLAIDLLVARVSSGWPHGVAHALELGANLLPGGAIIVAGQTKEDFTSAWRALREARPQYTCLRFPDGTTGIALAAEMPHAQ